MLQNLLQKNNNKDLIFRGITPKSFDNNQAKY